MVEEIVFTCKEEFHNWLFENHKKNTGIWLVFSKTSQLKTLKAQEALEEALCFGWIDGQLQSVNENKYLKKFTPRRKDSHWSQKNKKLAQQLIQSKRMTDAGMEAINTAKKDGRWEKAQPEPITEEEIKIFSEALEKFALAFANFSKMSPSVKKTYTAFYLDAKKEETKAKRLQQIIQRLNENKKPM